MSAPSREEEIFCAAFEKSSLAEREAYLDEVCRHDVALRQRVSCLLQADQVAGSFLETPIKELNPTLTQIGGSEAIGSQLGPYKLVQELGEGGMGTVFLAEQQQPVKRSVALKLLKPGMESRQILGRFEAERQTLALMDHPNVARVIDAGITSSGRPFFVMELAWGVPVVEYCDEHRLTIRQRLELFQSVCHAIQHAHQKGIIHRDVKPSNVLVCLQEEQAVAKVIDFGVAKLMFKEMSGDAAYTEVGQVVGTLEYMSPEQAQLNNADIDTRADIYSLGVLLYELLTGSTPLDRPRLKGIPLIEVLRMIREVEPPSPSRRLTQVGLALAETASRRRTDATRLPKQVCGELDWIVMKCLEKDRARRYETANALARDIDRFLSNEAVEACPPSWSYRLRKFSRRNKGSLATVGMLAGILLAATILSRQHALRATDAEAVATNARDRESRQRTIAVEQMQKAEQAEQRTKVALQSERSARQQTRAALDTLTDDVVERLLAGKPTLGPEEKTFLQKVLQLYEQVSTVDQQTSESRILRGDGHLRLGQIYTTLGNNIDAEKSLRIAEKLFTELAGDSPSVGDHRLKLIGVRSMLAMMLQHRGNKQAAMAVQRQAIQDSERLVADFPDNTDYRYAFAVACQNLIILDPPNTSNLDECETLLRHAREQLEIVTADPNCSPQSLLYLSSCYNNSGAVSIHRGDDAAAEASFEGALAVRERLGKQFPGEPEYQLYLANTLRNIAILQAKHGRRADAAVSLSRAVAIQDKIVSDFPGMPHYRQELALTVIFYGELLASDQPESALREFDRALSILAVSPPPGPLVDIFKGHVVNAWAHRAAVFEQLGHFSEALAQWDQLIKAATPQTRWRWQLRRAASLARSGDHVRAVAEAEELATAKYAPGDVLYDCSCVLALASAAVKDDDALQQRDAARSIELLRQAWKEGFFDRSRVEHLKQDPDLNSLRDRSDYKELLADLEASVAANSVQGG